MRNIFNDLFAILKKQEDDITHLKREMEVMQVFKDELSIGSVATQIIIKMSQFQKINEHPGIAACRTISGQCFRPPDPEGSCRKDAGKSPDPARKHRKSLEPGSSIPTEN